MPPHQAPNTKPVGPVLVKIHYREVELRDKAENGWRPMAMSKLFLPDFRFVASGSLLMPLNGAS